MRTTVTLDDDVFRAVEHLRRDQGLGLSEALNMLARAGISRPERKKSYRHRTADLCLRIDVHDIADALETLDRTDG